jgi:hypothetical protein
MPIEWTVVDPSELRSILLREARCIWEQSPEASPFCGPTLLDVLWAVAEEVGTSPVFGRGFDPMRGVVAFWPLVLDSARILRFLQQGHGDECAALAVADLSISDLAKGLEFVIGETGAHGCQFHDLAPTAPTLAAISLALDNIGWTSKSFPAVSSPILEAKGGPAGRDAMRKRISGSSLRNLDNRLQRLPGFAFEALVGADGDLGRWVDDFCDCHESRWNVTDTPSAYSSIDRRALLKRKVEAWAHDGSLVRFSLRVGDERIAFCIGLRRGSRLVYHHIAHSPAFEQSSSATVLLRRIVLWMIDHGLDTLDFGLGSETYKGRFANTDQVMWRVYASRSWVSPNQVRGEVESWVRGSSNRERRWNRVVNELFRSRILARAHRASIRWSTFRRVHLRSSRGEFIGRLKGRLGWGSQIFYVAFGGGTHGGDSETMELDTFKVLEMLESEVGLLPRERAEYFAARRAGHRPFGLEEQGHVVQVCWLRFATADEVPPKLTAEDAVWCIADCFTRRQERGRGLYPAVLRAMVGIVPEGQPIVMYADRWNRGSHSGIRKAGFLPLAARSKRGRGRPNTWLPC